MVGRVAAELADTFRGVLGTRLVAFVIHGSAAHGGYLPGFSDLDCVAFTRGPMTVADCLAVGARVAALDPTPFASLQLSAVVDLDDPAGARPVLIPRAYEVLVGDDVDERYLHTEATLRASGRAWLRALPGLLTRDAQDWAVATAATRPRLVRLVMTRLKPALRALLVERGEPVLATWTASYMDLADRWDHLAPGSGARLRDVLTGLPAPAEHADRQIAAAFAMVVDIIEQATASTGP